MLIGLLLNYYCFLALYKASEHFSCDNFQHLSKKILPKSIYKLGLFSYTIDYSSSIIIYSLAGWHLVQYLLFYAGVIESKYVLDLKTMKFDDDNPFIFKLRSIYYGIIFIFSCPLLLNKRLDSLRYLSLCFILTIIVIFIFLTIQMPFIRSELLDEN